MDARRAAVALLLVMALPFLGRALNIDEPLYLTLAERVLAAPLDPFGGASFWHERPTLLYWDSYNPPLIGYLLAMPAWLAPESAAVLRLPIVLLGAICVWLAGAVARDLGLSECPALLLAASPVLALGSVSATTDVPFLLLSLLAWRSAVSGRAGVAGLLAGLSGVTKYAGVINIVIVGLCVAPRQRRVALALGALPLALWCLLSYLQHGQLHLVDAGRFQYFDVERQGRTLVSFVASLGIVAAPGALLLLRYTWAQALAALGVAAAAGAALLWAFGSIALAALGAAAWGGGVALLWAAVSATRRRGVPRLVPLAFWLFGAYAVLLVYFWAARYLLPLLPPLLWLLAAGGQLRGDASPRRWAAALVVSASLALGALWADAGYAGAWERLARDLDRTPQGRSLGHWGFQHYAARSGYPPLEPRETLGGEASLVVAHGVHGPPLWPAQRARLTPAGGASADSPPLRLMDRLALAGYYSDAWGLLPIGWRPGAVERVRRYNSVEWLPEVLARPLAGDAVSLMPGTPRGRHTLLDGWSEPESFEAAGARRSFVWTLGPEAALRLTLPAGVERISLVASADSGARGRLHVDIGPHATAVIDLVPGWRRYDAPIEGRVSGGDTVLVLRPIGHRRPSRLSRERRQLAVAVERLTLGPNPRAATVGAWPVLEKGRPALLVARSGVAIETSGRAVHGVVTDHAGDARLQSGETVLWRSTACSPAERCRFALGAGRKRALVLRATDAMLHELAPVAEASRPPR